jgi:hypothetical protein
VFQNFGIFRGMTISFRVARVGHDIALTDDLWVSMQHTAKKVPHYVEWESQGEKKPLKMKLVPRKKTTELF